MNYINLNGKIVLPNKAHLPIDNGAFRYGYGLFETMLITGGKINLANYHWDRLFEGMGKLYFEIPKLLTPQKLEEEVLKTVKKNNLESLCRVRLQAYMQGGGLYDPTTNQPGYLIACFEIGEDSRQLNQNGLVVGFAEGLNKSNDTLSNLKSCNALIYALAAKQAKEYHWNDALILNTKGNIIESTIANLFLVKGGTVFTPPLSDGCVAGVTRRNILNRCPEVVQKPISMEDLLMADELFLTNAIKGIRWVGNFAGKQYSNNLVIKDFGFVFDHS